jgi:hypothetical protein
MRLNPWPKARSVAGQERRLLAAPPTDPDVSNSLIRFVSNQKLASARLGLTRNLPASGAQLGCPGLRICWSSSALDELIGCGWRPQRVFRPPTQRTLCPAVPSLRRVPGTTVPRLPRPSLRTFGTPDSYDCRPPLSHASLPARMSIPDVFHQETDRLSRACPEFSAGFPSCPRERMPRSQTPVVSYQLALARVGLLPSACCKRRLWGAI